MSELLMVMARTKTNEELVRLFKER
jgi:hypothetical protein